MYSALEYTQTSLFALVYAQNQLWMKQAKITHQFITWYIVTSEKSCFL